MVHSIDEKIEDYSQYKPNAHKVFRWRSEQKTYEKQPQRTLQDYEKQLWFIANTVGTFS